VPGPACFILFNARTLNELGSVGEVLQKPLRRMVMVCG
jgi:hypothetical protein